ncbi:hypothetical protein C8Q77DRAFT_1114086, partial [Trametes polyzona]
MVTKDKYDDAEENRDLEDQSECENAHGSLEENKVGSRGSRGYRADMQPIFSHAHVVSKRSFSLCRTVFMH